MSNQIQATGDVKIRSLNGVLTGTTGVVGSLPINGSNGIPQLDSNGKILVSQLPNSVMEFKGMWNVTTNTPTLVNGTGNPGDVYLVTNAAVGGTTHDFGAGAILFFNGDQVIYDGTNWDRASGATGSVTSVAVTESSAALNITGSPITTSGTINIGFAGTSAQYVAGDGSLITFPSLSGYVPYTGATSDVDLGTHKLSLNSEQFASISAPSYSEGALWYDSTQKALAYYNDISGNVLHIGQEVQLKVHNNTGSTIAKGAPVYVTSTSSGGSSPNVALAKADTFTTSNVIGLANQAIATGTDGYITLSGLLTGVSTGAFAVGDILYLSPYSAGQLMNTLPPTGYAIKVGVVSYSNSPNGTIYINQSNAYSTAGSIVGTIAISQGGTGATTAAGALSNLGAAADNTVVHLAGTETITGAKTFLATPNLNSVKIDGYTYLNNLSTSTAAAGYTTLIAKSAGIIEYNFSSTYKSVLDFDDTANYTYTFPSATGTLALTSNLSSYVPYTGATGSVDLGIFNSLTAYNILGKGLYAILNGTTSSPLVLKTGSTGVSTDTDAISLVSSPSSARTLSIYFDIAGVYRKADFNANSLTATRTYTLPDASGTLALTSQLTSGTVTSVAALTLGTTGTDLSSTVANGTTTPIITLNVPTASATNRGVLSSADWTTFNSKQNALTNPVTGTATSGQVSYFNGTSSIAGSNNHYWDATNNRLGIGTTSPSRSLSVFSSTADSHVAIAGTAPSVSMTDTLTGATYQAKFGLATSSGQFASGSAAGDFVISNQAGNILWAYNSVEKMRLNTNGTVSIGNTNSTYNLDVTGTGRFTGDLYAQTATNGTANIKLGTAATTRLTISSSDATGDATIAVTANHNLILQPNGVNALTLAGTGAAAFSSSVTANGNLGLTDGSFSTGKSYSLYLGDKNAFMNSTFGQKVNFGAYNGFTFGFAQNGDLTTTSTWMTINGSGNVGIGTSSPSYPLDIYKGSSGVVLNLQGVDAYNAETSILMTSGRAKISGYLESSGGTPGSILAFSTMPNGGSITERMRITSGGEVLVNTTTARGGSVKMTINGTLRVGDGTNDVFSGGGQGRFFVDYPGVEAGRLNLDNSGNLTIRGSLTQNASDERLKNNIIIIPNALDKISKLRGVTFNWNNEIYKTDKTNDVGVIAQDVQLVQPEATTLAPFDTNHKTGESLSGENYLTVYYEKLIPLLIEGIKELNDRLNKLENK